jgi:6,7-dimethyl-8-ribityllumazine synthase
MSDRQPELIEGSLAVRPGARFAIVSSRFNELVVDRLVEGATSGFLRHGVPLADIVHVRVPGAWELSPTSMRLAKSGKFDAVVVCGCVIRGATAHFDYVAGEAARGVAQAGASSDVPVVFGVLTTDTLEQALERAGSKGGNKGFDAALTAIEMLSLFGKLKEHGF